MKGRTNAYYPVYIERKEYELARFPADYKARKIHSHRRALRYTEKRFLRDLWRQWRGQQGPGPQRDPARPAAT